MEIMSLLFLDTGTKEQQKKNMYFLNPKVVPPVGAAVNCRLCAGSNGDQRKYAAQASPTAFLRSDNTAALGQGQNTVQTVWETLRL